MKNFIHSLAAFTARILPPRFRKLFYHLGPLTPLIRKTLNKYAPKIPTKMQIAAGSLQGLAFILNVPNEKDYWLGTYETELLEAVRNLVKPGMIAYDIGANVGYVTLAFQLAASPDGKVFAFEALPENVQRLKANARCNPHLKTYTEIIHAAVTNMTKPVQFLVHSSDDMGKMIGAAGRAEKYEKEIIVPGISLDDFVFTQNHVPPDIIKMDIEGGEILALPGAKKLLTEAHPILLLELHGQDAAHTAWEFLIENGYEIHSLEPGFPHINTQSELGWKAYILAK